MEDLRDVAAQLKQATALAHEARTKGDPYYDVFVHIKETGLRALLRGPLTCFGSNGFVSRGHNASFAKDRS